MKRGFIAILHLILVIAAYSSPFWLDWRLFLIGMIIYYLQILIFKGCVLTYAQYGTFEKGFSTISFLKIFKFIGVKVNGATLERFLKYYLSTLLILLCIIWQILLKMPILLKLY